MFGPSKFEGFLAADFDAYQEKKWSSNRFNMERMKVNGKLEALARVLGEKLSAAGLDLEAEISQSNPTIFNNKCVDAGWLYFFRKAEERKLLAALIDKQKSIARNVADPSPYHMHIILTVRVDTSGVEVGLQIHCNAWLDGKNLFAKVKDNWQRETFYGLLSTLPTEMSVQLDGTPISGGQAPNDEQLAAAGKRFPQENEWIWFKRHYPREDELVGSAGLADEVWAMLEKLVPLYRFIAWSKENDHVSVKDQLRANTPAKSVAVGKLIEKKIKRKKAGIKDLKLEPKRKVEVTNGLFEKKWGIVDSIDGKGVAKVIIGNLTVKIPAADLKVIG